MRPRIYGDLTGKTYNRLTVIRPVIVNGKTKWECKCSCGKTTVVNGHKLINGKTKSCGCLQAEAAAERAKRAKTYGFTHHRLYACYYRMRRRCENPADSSYERYGGRGIKVCNEWKNDIMSFINWGLENGYREGLSIDRIDNNGDYSPNNCRWANVVQQCNNRRTNKFISYNGETHTYAEWSRIVGIKQLTIRHRIENLGWSIEDALTISTDERRYGVLQNANVRTAVYKEGKLIAVCNSMDEASKKLGIGKSSVSRHVKSGTPTRSGYVFRQYEASSDRIGGVGSTGRG